jgi:dTDP-4-dehydrorhamnose 3,5-epimerase
MNRERLQIEGAFAFKVSPFEDDRGSLIRVFDSVELFPNFNVVQASYVENPQKGTLRGLHFQTGKFAENKIIQCITGSIFDVQVDLRPNSHTFKKSFSITLGPEEEFQGIFIPKNCAHGYLTLEKNSNLIYLMDNKYSVGDSQGLNWDNEEVEINWPLDPAVISKKDLSLPKTFCN